MIKLELNGEELLRLIEVCGKSGVSQLKLGKDIELTFGGNANLQKVPDVVQANTTLEKEIEVESFAKVQASNRKEALEEMKLMEPELYEKLLTSGDLVDEAIED